MLSFAYMSPNLIISAKKLLILSFFLLAAKLGFAQTDTLNMPMHDGRLEYTATIPISNKTYFQLDTTAKGWFNRYVHYRQFVDSNTNSSVLAKGALEFRMTTTSVALVKYTFFLYFDIQIDCKENSYSYKISNIYFTPKNSFFRKVIIHQSSPEYLIDLYNKKHMGFANSVNFGRRKVREYLTRTDDTILACIASLNQAMAK